MRLQQTTEWEKIYANHIADKGLTSKMYNELTQCKSKKQTMGRGSKSERERQIYDITYMWNLAKKKIQMNSFTKQKQTHRSQNQTYGYQRGNMGGSDKLGD